MINKTEFKDHFSQVSQQYATYRPDYPAALVNALAAIVPSTECALDCGCGTGQLSVLLAQRFNTVIATDASEAQISQAKLADKIQYRVALAEDSGLADNSVDLITVAQAAHWLDLDKFYREVKRIAKPNAIIALITYGVLHVEGELDGKIQTFYYDTVGPYWPPERRHVEEGYRNLAFPFEEVTLTPMYMQAKWNLAQLMGYLTTWSAVKAANTGLGYDTVEKLSNELASDWGDPQAKKLIRWSLSVRAGKVIK